MAIVQDTMQVGVVVRRAPGVTRWAKWNWTVSAVFPGAGPADWREIRREGEATEYHAATLPLTLYSSDTDAYRNTLAGRTPSLYVVMRDELESDAELPWRVDLITANAYEGQGYAESGDGLVELVPMPLAMIAWIHDFVTENHVEQPFVKRKRDRERVDLLEDGKGDRRIRQISDVYRAPHSTLRGGR